MPVSVFDMFKIGIGPSSSHTMGPMTAAATFLDLLRRDGARPSRIRASLHGSLAFTGKGHATDRAVLLGLLGETPAAYDPDRAEHALARLHETKRLSPDGLPDIAFNPDVDLLFDYGPPLPGHANGLILTALGPENAVIATETYYSIGGGFIATASELAAGPGAAATAPTPYPFTNAAQMLEMAARSGRSIAEMTRENERVFSPELASDAALDAALDKIWAVMNACIDRGLSQDGELPGGLKVRRRARSIRAALLAERGRNDLLPHQINEWISLYAMAVNEENAAGGRIVTAPTNGAAGVTPAVIRYYLDHAPSPNGEEKRLLLRDFLLTAAAIGGVIKRNASISGAEVGCQGEVGSASAMAAAGLAAVLGGTPAQIENAAEIALEHHLGMTCDPVGGLVQVPCIERNGLGAVKAVTAASLALRGDGTHFMPLDNAIEAMRQTGIDMNHRYKETSLGGLAVNLPEC